MKASTDECTRSILRTHVLPRWDDWPLARIDHLSVQRWVRELADSRAPATVKKALNVLSLIVVSAVRSQLPPALRFHDLRHSYATWLVADGVPVNVVSRLMGHEQISTTLDRYTHDTRDYADLRVRQVFADLAADDLLTPGQE